MPKRTRKPRMRPCSFCGSVDLDVGVGDHGFRFIRCVFCQAKGPLARGERSARSKWNTRKGSSAVHITGLAKGLIPAEGKRVVTLKVYRCSDCPINSWLDRCVEHVTKTPKKVLEETPPPRFCPLFQDEIRVDLLELHCELPQTDPSDITSDISETGTVSHKGE